MNNSIIFKLYSGERLISEQNLQSPYDFIVPDLSSGIYRVMIYTSSEFLVYDKQFNLPNDLYEIINIGCSFLITGKVTHLWTGNPISGINVSLNNGITTLTNDNGEYSILIPFENILFDNLLQYQITFGGDRWFDQTKEIAFKQNILNQKITINVILQPDGIYGFEGYVNPSEKFRYCECRDWDRPLFSSGVWEGGLSYPVDGHVVFEYVFDDKTGKEKIISVESTGGYAGQYPVGNEFTMSDIRGWYGQIMDQQRRHWMHGKTGGQVVLYNDLNGERPQIYITV